MLALIVKIPMMQHLRKMRSFSADSKYSADHSSLLRFPHLRWLRLYSTTGSSPIGSQVLSARREHENEYGIPYLSIYMDPDKRKSKEYLHKS